ncbi:hypothetical protein D1007_16488 [Hordeum vulgare]|nr:hypothetical protein D1007_16488 [Hordeum vulgare]
MVCHADILLTPSYTRDPFAAVAGDANHSTGSFGFAFAGAPPSTGLARGLFMTSQTTSRAGGVPRGALREATCPPLEAPKCGGGEDGQGVQEEEQSGGRLLYDRRRNLQGVWMRPRPKRR